MVLELEQCKLFAEVLRRGWASIQKAFHSTVDLSQAVWQQNDGQGKRPVQPSSSANTAWMCSDDTCEPRDLKGPRHSGKTRKPKQLLPFRYPPGN